MALPPCPHCGQNHAEDVLLCPTAEKQMPLEGRILDGKFRFVKQLGEGGMGAVWRAENVLVKKLVAIKLMHVQFSRDEGVLARFRNEATAAGRIGSHHICDILDLGRSSLGPYIVMEMLKGTDFAEHMIKRRGPTDTGFVVKVMRQALIGLQAAHEVGIVHRDLKPENIFLHEPTPGQLVVKLMDFGISKFTEGELAGRTGVGVLMGTPEYMSPEQTEGAAQVDVRTDVWAMGVILYWALAGRNPFAGATMAATLVNVSTREVPPVHQFAPSVPAGLADVIARCLRKRPDERFASARELSDALAPYETSGAGATVMAAGLPVAAPPSVGPATPPPGGTAFMSGPPPGAAAPTGTPPPPTFVSGVPGQQQSGPTWGGNLAATPSQSAPTMGGPDQWNIPDDGRPPTSNIGGGGGKVAIIAVLGLVLVGGIGAAVFVMGKGKKDTVATSDAGADGKSADDGAKADGGEAKSDEGKADEGKADDGGEAKADEGKAAEGGEAKADEGKADEGKAEGGETGGVAGADDGKAASGTSTTGAASGADPSTTGASAGDDAKTSDDGGKTSGDGGKTSGDGGKTSGDDGGGTHTTPKKFDSALARAVGSNLVTKKSGGPFGSVGAANAHCSGLAAKKFAKVGGWRLTSASEIQSLKPSSGQFWAAGGSYYDAASKKMEKLRPKGGGPHALCITKKP